MESFITFIIAENPVYTSLFTKSINTGPLPAGMSNGVAGKRIVYECGDIEYSTIQVEKVLLTCFALPPINTPDCITQLYSPFFHGGIVLVDGNETGFIANNPDFIRCAVKNNFPVILGIMNLGIENNYNLQTLLAECRNANNILVVPFDINEAKEINIIRMLMVQLLSEYRQQCGKVLRS